MALSPQLGALRVLLLHSDLGGATQQVYDTEGGEGHAEPKEEEHAGPAKSEKLGLRRRVILTDALGEASFSLPNIRYVIDTGLQLKTVS